MIRFIDLSRDYFGVDPGESMEDTMPVCAFVDTITNRFLADSTGSEVFRSIEDVQDIPIMAPRCLALVPDDFFSTKETTP